MSGEKRFQKTFTRRKKASNGAEDQVQAVAEEDANVEEEEAVVVPSSSVESQGEVARQPISMRKGKNDGGGNAGRKQQPKQKRKKEEEKTQKKKQRKEELKMKPKQKQEKRQNGKDGNKELKRRKKKKKKEEDVEEEEEADVECRFPVSRVDRIIRSEGSDYRITHEAVFLINKASEKFLEIFCGDSYKRAAHDSKNYVSYNHLSTVVNKEKRLDFLSDYVPEKVTVEKALAEQKPVEK